MRRWLSVEAVSANRMLIGYLLAALVSGVLVSLIDPSWTIKDWYSAVVLGVGLATVGMIVSHRQADLQQRMASLELIEKVSVLVGHANDIRCSRADRALGSARMMLHDARAGVELCKYAPTELRGDFLDAVSDAVEELVDRHATLDERELEALDVGLAVDKLRQRLLDADQLGQSPEAVAGICRSLRGLQQVDPG